MYVTLYSTRLLQTANETDVMYRTRGDKTGSARVRQLPLHVPQSYQRFQDKNFKQYLTFWRRNYFFSTSCI